MNSDNDEEAFDLGGLSNPEEASDSEEADEGVDADLFLQEKYPSDELSADALAELEQLVGNSPQDTQAAWKYCTEDGNEGPFLRDYQIESVQRTLLHWRDSETPAAISLPTATGKSWVGVALAAIAAVAVPDADLRGQSHPRVLILTPSSAIKDGLMRKCRRMFRTLGMDEMSSVIELCANGSSVAGTASDFQDQRVTEARVVIGTTQKAWRVYQQASEHFFHVIMIDEGHHAAATTYKSILQYYSSAKKLLLSATMKRPDNLEIDCKLILHRSLAWAARKGYTKQPVLVLVKFHSVTMKEEGGEKRELTLSGEELSDALNSPSGGRQGLWKSFLENYEVRRILVATTMSLLVKQRSKSGSRHCALLAARGREEVEHISAMATVCPLPEPYQERASCDYLHSKRKAREVTSVKERSAKGTLHALAATAIINEGWDNPTLSIVTVMRSIRSCAFFYQLVGRALRPLTIIDDSIHREAIAGDISKFPGKVVPKSNDDLQEDQVCYVVVPDGQNIEKLWGRLGIDADFQDLCFEPRKTKKPRRGVRVVDADGSRVKISIASADFDHLQAMDLHGQPVEGPPAPTSSQISSISEEEVELKRRSYIRNAIPDGIQDLLNGHMTEIRAGIQQSAQDTAQANAELVQQLMAAVRDR